MKAIGVIACIVKCCSGSGYGPRQPIDICNSFSLIRFWEAKGRCFKTATNQFFVRKMHTSSNWWATSTSIQFEQVSLKPCRLCKSILSADTAPLWINLSGTWTDKLFGCANAGNFRSRGGPTDEHRSFIRQPGLGTGSGRSGSEEIDRCTAIPAESGRLNITTK